MTIPPWTDEAKARAKKNKSWLVKIHLQGRYAGSGQLAFSGDVSDEVARETKILLVKALSHELGRMLDDEAKTNVDKSCSDAQSPGQWTAILDLIERDGCDCDDYREAGQHDCLPGQAEAGYYALLHRAEEAESQRGLSLGAIAEADKAITVLTKRAEKAEAEVKRLKAEAAADKADPSIAPADCPNCTTDDLCSYHRRGGR